MLTVSEKLDFIKRAFGAFTHDRNFANVSVSCPQCALKKKTSKKKFVIHTDSWRAHCWVCGYKCRSLVAPLKLVGRGDMISEYVSKFHASESLADAFASDLPEVLRLPEGFSFVAVALQSQQRDPAAHRAWSYLRSRGVTERDLWYFKFGYSTDLAMSDRVIMPSYDATGKLNYYAARRMDGKRYKKYINSSIPSSSIVFNELNVDWSSRVVLVEGPFDLLKCQENAVPLLGSIMSEESLLFNMIVSHGTPVAIALDADAQRKAHRCATLLSSYGIDVSMVSLGSSDDPGSMERDDLATAIASARPWSRDEAIRSKVALLGA